MYKMLYLYMTPSPMTFPMKQATTAIQPQKPPSGAGGAIFIPDFLETKEKRYKSELEFLKSLWGLGTEEE
jgi:hypothetical protein